MTSTKWLVLVGVLLCISCNRGSSATSSSGDEPQKKTVPTTDERDTRKVEPKLEEAEKVVKESLPKTITSGGKTYGGDSLCPKTAPPHARIFSGGTYNQDALVAASKGCRRRLDLSAPGEKGLATFLVNYGDELDGLRASIKEKDRDYDEFAVFFCCP